MKRCVVGMVTCSSKAEARKLAAVVLRPKLAACVNILGGAESHYWWKGKLEKAGECVLLIKTTQDKTAAVTKAIRAAHSYEVAEIIFLPIVRGEARYLRWLRGAVAALLFLCAATVRGDEVDDLVKRMRGANEEARAEAADQLARIGGPRVVQEFRGMLASANPESRQMAVIGLLRVSDADEDLERVRARLQDDNSMVRWSAVLALSQTGRREVVPWLEAAAKSDASELVREMAAESVAKLQSRVQWWRSLSAGLKEARKAAKPVLVYFFVADSQYCGQFEAAVLADKDVVQRVQEFVCVRVDAARYADDARRYDVRGAPTVVLLDRLGEELARVAGVVEKEKLLARLAEARRGTATFRELQQQARRHPSDVEVNWKVAQTFLDEGREDLAEPHLRNVIAGDEVNRYGCTDKALFALGVVLGHQKRHAQAAYCHEQLLERWPSFVQKDKALYCLGLSRLALRQTEKARVVLEQLVREFPESAVVKQAKETLEKSGAK